MDKFIPANLREKLWSIFLTGLVAVLLSMLQATTGASAVDCHLHTDPAVAGTLGMVLRTALYSVRLA